MASSSQLPRTPGSAPPNFYSQVGQQGAPGAGGQGAGAGAGQQPGQAASGAPGQPAPQAADPDSEFLDASTKLLTVLDKIGQMQPRGMDISKYTKAASQVMKDCVKQVFPQGGKAQSPTPGATSSAADQGVGGNQSAGSSSNAGVASASNATGTA